MDRPVELVPLVCFKCETPIPALPDEVAWVCSQCGQGLALDEAQGLAPLEIQYASEISPGATGKPFWVAQGRVYLTRQVYGRSNKEGDAQRFWEEPHEFFVPAYTCPLDVLLTLGPRLLLQPPQLSPGRQALFEPVTLSIADVQSMAEFIVMAIEAERSDMVKEVQASVKLSTPSLWVLP